MPNIVFTVAEKIQIVKHREQGLSLRRIADHFAAAYPNRPIPSKSTVRKIVKQFRETGNLDPSLVRLSYPSKQVSEETKLNICLSLTEGPEKSMSTIAKELNISKSSVQRVIRTHNHSTVKDKNQKQIRAKKSRRGPNIVFTVAERIEMVQRHEQGLGYQRISDHFAAAHPDRPIPAKNTVKSIIKRFDETGNVDPNLVRVSNRGTRLKNITEKEESEKSNSSTDVEDEDSESAIQMSSEDEGIMPFEFHSTETIEMENDFSNGVVVNLHADSEIFDKICFCDECTVELLGPQNTDLKPLSGQHPHLFIESGTHSFVESVAEPQQLTVWVGVIEDRLLGPFFINGDLNGQKYLQMWKEDIIPALKSVREKDPIVWFQQDMAPSHFTAAVVAYLDQELPGHWIGRGGPGRRPKRSSGVTLLDYPLWYYLNKKLHAQSPIRNLQEIVTKVVKDMDPCTLCDIKV